MSNVNHLVRFEDLQKHARFLDENLPRKSLTEVLEGKVIHHVYAAKYHWPNSAATVMFLVKRTRKGPVIRPVPVGHRSAINEYFPIEETNLENRFTGELIDNPELPD